MKDVAQILVVSMMSLSSLQSRAQVGPHGGMQVSDGQRQCLESKVGKPSPSSRPSKEKMEAAFKDCGINDPKLQGAPQITQEQKLCMESKVARPGSGDKQPTQDQMQSAAKACGLTIPELGSSHNLSPDVRVNSLISAYESAKSDQEKAQAKDAIKAIFYASNSEALKEKIRNFFKENRDPTSSSIPSKENETSTGVR